MSFRQVEYIILDLTLEANHNKVKAAEVLGVSLKTLYNLIRSHGLSEKYIEQRYKRYSDARAATHTARTRP